MGIMGKLSIKKFLSGIIYLLTLLLILLSVSNLVWYSKENRQIKKINIANSIADDVLEASGILAQERGIVSEALSSKEPASMETLNKILETRTKSGKILHDVFEQVERLSAEEGSNEAFATTVKKARDSFSALEDARKSVDGNLKKDEKKYTAKEWIGAITSFIDTAAELRLSANAASARGDALAEALRLNVELKQSAWLVSEYAGRERANLAPFIASKKPLDKETLEKLEAFRAVVELNMKTLQALHNMNGAAPEVKKAIEKMESVFWGRFQQVRLMVYAAKTTGNYPISGKEWIEKSTEAINSTLDVSAAVGGMVHNNYANLSDARWNMALAVVMLVFVICVCLFSLRAINGKVIKPMRYLSETMSSIEKTKDLTIKLNVETDDESGAMAEAFNKMMRALHGVIKETRASIERLASASEELSATAAQIANGTKAQS